MLAACGGGTDAEGQGGAASTAPGFDSLTWSGAPGARDWLFRRPADEDGTPRPLFVALHGCSQTAAQLAEIARLAELADEQGAYVALPEQSLSANPYRCWNWFDPSSQARDAGEPAILAGIVSEAMSMGTVDPERVHVFGLSAGGAMSVVLAATWPDMFASAGSVAGCAYRGTPCLSAPSSASTDELVSFVMQAMGDRARLVPLIVMQGDADTTVPPANADVVVRQWLGLADRLDDGSANGSVASSAAQTSEGSVPSGYDYEVAAYEWGSGEAIVERWLIAGEGHAWPGGLANRAWSDPKGPDATREIARFFAAHPMSSTQ